MRNVDVLAQLIFKKHERKMGLRFDLLVVSYMSTPVLLLWLFGIDVPALRDKNRGLRWFVGYAYAAAVALVLICTRCPRRTFPTKTPRRRFSNRAAGVRAAAAKRCEVRGARGKPFRPNLSFRRECA